MGGIGNLVEGRGGKVKITAGAAGALVDDSDGGLTLGSRDAELLATGGRAGTAGKASAAIVLRSIHGSNHVRVGVGLTTGAKADIVVGTLAALAASTLAQIRAGLGSTRGGGATAGRRGLGGGGSRRGSFRVCSPSGGGLTGREGTIDRGTIAQDGLDVTVVAQLTADNGHGRLTRGRSGSRGVGRAARGRRGRGRRGRGDGTGRGGHVDRVTCNSEGSTSKEGEEGGRGVHDEEWGVYIKRVYGKWM